MSRKRKNTPRRVLKINTKYNPPGKKTPVETLAYLNPAEANVLKLLGGAARPVKKGVRSYYMEGTGGYQGGPVGGVGLGGGDYSGVGSGVSTGHSSNYGGAGPSPQTGGAAQNTNNAGGVTSNQGQGPSLGGGGQNTGGQNMGTRGGVQANAGGGASNRSGGNNTGGQNMGTRGNPQAGGPSGGNAPSSVDRSLQGMNLANQNARGPLGPQGQSTGDTLLGAINKPITDRIAPDPNYSPNNIGLIQGQPGLNTPPGLVSRPGVTTQGVGVRGNLAYDPVTFNQMQTIEDIAIKERTNRYGDPFDVVFNYGQGFSPITPTQTTWNDILNWQENNVYDGTQHPVVGAGQFKPDTIRGLANLGVINLNDPATPEAQIAAMEQLITDRIKAGQNPLADWASITTPKGKTRPGNESIVANARDAFTGFSPTAVNYNTPAAPVGLPQASNPTDIYGHYNPTPTMPVTTDMGRVNMAQITPVRTPNFTGVQPGMSSPMAGVPYNDNTQYATQIPTPSPMPAMNNYVRPEFPGALPAMPQGDAAITPSTMSTFPTRPNVPVGGYDPAYSGAIAPAMPRAAVQSVFPSRPEVPGTLPAANPPLSVSEYNSLINMPDFQYSPIPHTPEPDLYSAMDSRIPSVVGMPQPSRPFSVAGIQPGLGAPMPPVHAPIQQAQVTDPEQARINVNPVIAATPQQPGPAQPIQSAQNPNFLQQVAVNPKYDSNMNTNQSIIDRYGPQAPDIIRTVNILNNILGEGSGGSNIMRFIRKPNRDRRNRPIRNTQNASSAVG